MELVVPSLVALLVGIAIAFFILPRLAPTLLITGSVIVLGAALYLHYSRFGRMEYEQATWQYNLKQYGSWIMVGAVLLGAYGFYAMNTGQFVGITPAILSPSSNAAAAPSILTPEMPNLSMPQSAGGFKNVAKTAMGRVNSLLRHGRINV
jgi:hypothetical protein